MIMKKFEIRNKNKNIYSLDTDDLIYDITTNGKHKILSADLVERRGKHVMRFEVKEGYVYENEIKERWEWKNNLNQ